MKKIILLLILVNFLIISFLPLVTGYTLLDLAGDPYGTNKTSFDDVSTGLREFTSGYFIGDDISTGGGDFLTSNSYDLTPPNSLQIYDDSAPYGGAEGYLNLTTTFDYINLINFSFVCSATNDFYMTFFDSDDNALIQLRFHSTLNDLYWYNNVSGWQTIYTDLQDYDRYYLRIQHNATNQFWVTLLNATFNINGSLESAGAYGGDWTTFSYIYVDQGSEGGGLYLDNFFIEYGEEEGDTEPERSLWCSFNIPELDSFIGDPFESYRFLEVQFIPFNQNGLSGNLDEVELYIGDAQYNGNNNTSRYDLAINGNNVGNPDRFESYSSVGDCTYKIVWDNLSFNLLNNDPVLSFGCYDIVYGSSYWYNHGVDEDTSFWKYYVNNNSGYHNDTGLNGFEINYDLAFCLIIDNASIPDVPNETTDEPSFKDFYFRFIDRSTGEPLRFKGTSVDEGVMGAYDYCDMLIFSTVTTDGLTHEYSLAETVTVNANFTEGQYVDFHFMNIGFSDFTCRIDDVYESFKPLEQTIQLYSGQTYNIYLEPVWYYGGVEYLYCAEDVTSWIYIESKGNAELCINKQTYDLGETLRGRYRLPTGEWLSNNGYKSNTGDYQLKVYNRDDYLLGNRRSFLHESPRVYTFDIPSSHFNNQYHTFQIDLISYNEYGFDNYWNDYEMVIDAEHLDIFKANAILKELIFYCSGSDFDPTGSITSITPNPCYLGQPVTFSWTSNGIGHLEICNPDGSTSFTVPYGYSSGTHTATKTISTIGELPINLYVYNLYENETTLNPEDTDTLTCNPLGDNGTFGSYGYGLPYLYIPRYRGIAGYDTIYIYYRTYKNDSILKILSPRNETSYFSTTVSNQSDNVLSIELPNYMQIGNWNVTFECGDINGNNVTLYSSFNVVNEEGNWIEFTKHTYTTAENFGVHIKHSYRVAITFYKDNVAQGESIIFEDGEYPNDVYVVPLSTIQPQVGNWRVEMWRINDRNQVYELAEWTCTVISAPFTVSDPTSLGFNVALIPVTYRIIIGLALLIFITISPLVIAIYLSQKRNMHINVPSLLYVAFFFIGLVTTVIIGFFEVWVLFLTLLAIIMVYVITWIRGSSQNKVISEGE